ncbi:MAG: sigma-70 family RNA polymerase sigma factor [Planctomycetaceae bacterium]|nr:sigma-70 family RNA polymerase sigma factor [Planctomycetaceae bacterium]
MGAVGSTTSLTLLGRLRSNPNDQEAWNSFVERYGTKIYAWCRRWNLQEADASDVTQNVMLELARQMSGFEYRSGGSFRGWLKTIAFRAWRDFLSARKRTLPHGCDILLDQLEMPGAEEDLFRRLEEECERELMETAMAQVRLRVQPHTWQAFVLTAIEGRSGAEVATQLGMQVGAVWVARSKVQKFIRDEVNRLEGDDGNPVASTP